MGRFTARLRHRQSGDTSLLPQKDRAWAVTLKPCQYQDWDQARLNFGVMNPGSSIGTRRA